VTADDPDPLSGGELATFVAAMDAASVHGAADALNLTGSAVTKRLQSLERRLGVTLFERGRFGLRSTEAGRLLYPEARQALLALARAREAVASVRDADAHRLSLAASHTIGEFLLPAWLAAFRRHQPAVLAQVDIVNSPGVIAAVRDHRADVGFVEGLDHLPGLDAITVYEDELVAVVAKGHRWAQRRSVRARELLTDSFLSRESRSGTRAVAESALAAIGVELVPALEVASIQSVKRALSSGGFTLMSGLAIATEVKAGSLHPLRVRGVVLTRRLQAIRDPRHRTAPTARRFWTWLQRETAEPGP
jgi:DNA-binding transcriptional LysR family regulator